jgi:hypothetical protein
MSAIDEGAVLERLARHESSGRRFRSAVLADINRTLDDFERFPNPVMRPGLEYRLHLLTLELGRAPEDPAPADPAWDGFLEEHPELDG